MPHTVTIEKSGHTFAVEEHQNVLAAGLAADLMLPYNCRSGLCRVCKSRIIEGEIAYPDRPLDAYLSEQDVAEGWVLLCQAHARSDLLVAADEIVDVANIRPQETPCRIVEMVRLADDIMVVKLRLPMNENVRYLPGQHLGFLLANGAKRNYSMANHCGSVGTNDIELHIRHTPGGLFTDQLFRDIKVRALMKIELPLGSFFLRPHDTKPILLLATGTGFAPVKAMIEHMVASGVHEKRPVYLYLGGRHRSDLYMHELAVGWAHDYTNIHYTPVLSRPSSEAGWDGRIGYVQDAAAADHPNLSGFQIYACGLPAMIEDAENLLTHRCGAQPSEFFMDEFLTEADLAKLPAKTEVS